VFDAFTIADAIQHGLARSFSDLFTLTDFQTLDKEQVIIVSLQLSDAPITLLLERTSALPQAPVILSVVTLNSTITTKLIFLSKIRHG
jgi:hypothetical protein